MGDSDGMAGRRAHSHVCVLERHDAKSLRAGPRQTRRARVNRSVRHGRRYASTSYIALDRRPHTPSSSLILSMGISIVTRNIITAPAIIVMAGAVTLDIKTAWPTSVHTYSSVFVGMLAISVGERERERELASAAQRFMSTPPYACAWADEYGTIVHRAAYITFLIPAALQCHRTADQS